MALSCLWCACRGLVGCLGSRRLRGWRSLRHAPSRPPRAVWSWSEGPFAAGRGRAARLRAPPAHARARARPFGCDRAARPMRAPAARVRRGPACSTRSTRSTAACARVLACSARCSAAWACCSARCASLRACCVSPSACCWARWASRACCRVRDRCQWADVSDSSGTFVSNPHRDRTANSGPGVLACQNASAPPAPGETVPGALSASEAFARIPAMVQRLFLPQRSVRGSRS